LRLIVDLFHVLYFSGSMCVGVTVWFGWVVWYPYAGWSTSAMQPYAVLTASQSWENNLRKGLRVKQKLHVHLDFPVHFNVAYLRPQFLPCLKVVFHLGTVLTVQWIHLDFPRGWVYSVTPSASWHISTAYTRNWGIYSVLFVAWTKHTWCNATMTELATYKTK